MPKKKFTREELYECVWSTPMLQLSKRFGLSDVGLAKTCRKFDIPHPPPGYWAKVQAGQKPPKTKLPRKEGDESIVLNDLTSAEIDSRTQAESASEARTPIVIPIAETLRGAHPLVSAAREQLEKGKVGDSGIVALPEAPALNLSVSRAQANRALRIVDAILKYAVAEGLEVSTGPIIRAFGERVPFGIKESTKAIEEQAEQVDVQEEYEFLHSRFKTRYEPSGKLALFIGIESYTVSGSRRQWKDTENRRIEDYLGSFFAGAIHVAEKLRDQTEENKRRELASVVTAK